jgi:hypothetical protein
MNDYSTVTNSGKQKRLINFNFIYLYIIYVLYKYEWKFPEGNSQEWAETCQSCSGLIVKSLYRNLV